MAEKLETKYIGEAQQASSGGSLLDLMKASV